MKILSPLPFCVGVILLLTITGHAQTWDGGGADNNFNTALNWNANVVPVNNGTANLIFAGTVDPTPVVNVNFDVNGITFNNTAGIFTISASGGSVLTVRGGGIDNNDLDTQTFSAPVTFATGSAITAASGDLNFTSAGSVGLGTNTVTVSGGFDTFLNAIVGTGVLVKNGAGVLNISGFGLTQYGLILNAGTVNYSGSVVPTGSNATFAVAGGTLALAGNFTLSSGASLNTSVAATFTLAANRTMIVQSGSDATLGDSLTTASNSIYRVTGAGSTFETAGLTVNSSGRVEVLASGTFATAAGSFLLGSGGTSGSILVDGVGSVFTNLTSSSVNIGSGSGSAGNLTLANVARGFFPSSSLVLAPSFGSGTMIVKSGAQVSAGTGEIASSSTSGTASLLITGSGSKLTATFNVADFSIGATSGGVGTVTVADGGELVLLGPLSLNETGTLNLDGGIVTMASSQTFTNHGVLNFNAGRFTFGESFNLGGGVSPLGINLTLQQGKEVIVPSTRTTTVASPGSLVINGGLFQTGALTNNGGTIDLLFGTLRITGSAGLTIGSSGPLGGNVTIPAGATLDVSSATVASDALLDVDGGSFIAGTLVNNGSTIIEAGSASVNSLSNNNGAQLFVARNLATTGTLENANGATLEMLNVTGRLLGAGTLRNNGLLTGSGTILKPVTNGVTGEIRASSGQTLLISGNFSANSGELTLQGGTLDFVGKVTNAASGFIAGRGVLYTAGLQNAGQMAFSGGNADIHGDVTNSAGARIVTSGAGTVTTFYDDLVHNGLEIFTGAGASTVIFGGLTGTGSFTGAGTVYSIGDLRPGASPANINFGGDLILGSFGRTVIEIGGTAPGTQHDRLTVARTLYPGGTLEVQLINGFIPVVGQTFDILDAATFNGSFSSVILPPLPPGRFWNTDAVATTGVLSVVAAPKLNSTNNGTSLGFSWSGAFKLQAQTNSQSVGISTNWGDYPGGGTSPVSVPIDVRRGSVFFRLSSP